MTEKWNAYLRDGSLTDTILYRDQAIPDGLYHLVVECLIQHQDGSLLLIQRHPDKPAFANYFEASAGGSALYGESPQEAIIREIKEETGLDVTPHDLKDRQTFFNDQFHCYFRCFTAQVSAPKTSIQLQKEETVSYVWIRPEELPNFFESAKVIPRHQDFLKELYVSYFKSQKS